MESPAPAHAPALTDRVRALVREQRIDPRSQAHEVRDLPLVPPGWVDRTVVVADADAWLRRAP